MEAPANAIKVEKCTSFLNEDEISLEESLKVAHEAIDIFLNNQFDEAREMVKPLADRSIYHAAIYGVTSLFEALMTFEKNQNVRKKGVDLKFGEIVAKKNTLINSRIISSIAMSNNNYVYVKKKPVIGILSTGNSEFIASTIS